MMLLPRYPKTLFSYDIVLPFNFFNADQIIWASVVIIGIDDTKTTFNDHFVFKNEVNLLYILLFHIFAFFFNIIIAILMRWKHLSYVFCVYKEREIKPVNHF